MEANKIARPVIFIDADVLFAGAASPNEHSASNLILRMAELTLIDAIASTQVIVEVERNLQEKMPKALPAFQLLVQRCLNIVSDLNPSELKQYADQADPDDLPILVAAIKERCSFMTTFNIRHYRTGNASLTIMKPGDLVLRIRYLLSQLPDH